MIRVVRHSYGSGWAPIATAPAVIVSVLALAACSRSQAKFKMPDPEVLVASPVQQDVAVHSEWVATLDGYVNAEIRPQVSGYIISQNYKEGAAVRKGQVLFEIDPQALPGGPRPRQGAARPRQRQACPSQGGAGSGQR